jgi:cysteinyl-tRNA synthetase
VAALHELRSQAAKGSAGARSRLKTSAALLGLLGGTAEEWFAAKASGSPIDLDAVAPRISARLAFIAQKNWAEADKIRDELLSQGIQLKDGKDPATGDRVTTWEVRR